MTQPLNVGELDYDALLLSVNKRFGHNYEARVSYTLSRWLRTLRLAIHYAGAGRAKAPGARAAF